MPVYRSVFILIVLAVSLVISAGAQTGVLQSPAESKGRPEYKFISTNKSSTFENELNAAAKEGYRLAKLAKTVFSSSIAGLVVREQDKPAVVFEYRLLAASRFSTFKKEFA